MLLRTELKYSTVGELQYPFQKLQSPKRDFVQKFARMKNQFQAGRAVPVKLLIPFSHLIETDSKVIRQP